MEFGTFFFPTDYAVDIRALAPAVEDRGFESLFLCEHTHIPTSRKSPWAGGAELPRQYWHTHDPFVALSFAAAATKTLKLGTGICLLTERDPIVTAKAVASLDVLSEGRFMLGIGAGWNAEEMAHHGTPFKSRFKILRERALAMKALWTQEEAEFHGEFVEFAPSWSYPKPLQKPHPPILHGGETVHTMRRVMEFCDGWFPRCSRDFDPAAAMTEFRQVAEEAGRDMDSLSVTVFRAPPKRAVIDKFAEAGITRVLFELPSDDRDTVLRTLDEHAKLIG